MKTTKILALAFASAIALTACTKNDETTLPGDGAVRFTAGIGAVATPESRAAGTTWGNDAIGVFMVDDNTTTVVEGAANRKYTTTAGSTAFTAADNDNKIYYPMDGSAVDFIAYYPYADTYSALTAPYAIDIETAQNATNQPGFDLLYSANASGSKATGATPVVLAFDHMLSKIVINIVQPGTSANSTGLVNSDLLGMTVTIKGMFTKAEFNLATGALGTVDDESDADISPRPITDGKSYDAIILPDEYENGEVTVTFALDGGDTYTWNVGEKTFEPKTEYAFDVTITKTGVTATGKINSWISAGDPDDVTAE